MRLKFTLELENETLPIDFRRKIVATFKNALSQYDSDYFEALYGKGKVTNKDFTFSVYFIPPTKMDNETVTVESKRLIVNFSTADANMGIQFYNALTRQKFKAFSLSDINEIKLVNIQMEKERTITGNSATFTIQSPIVIRDHNDEGKDWFFLLEDDNAIDILKRNLKTELKDKFDRDISYDIDALEIEILKFKKVVVKSYNLNIPCSLGTIKMQGEQYLLKYLYDRGVGSRRSMGFGMLNLV